MGPRRFSPAGLALVALAIGFFADVARASERLPIRSSAGVFFSPASTALAATDFSCSAAARP